MQFVFSPYSCRVLFLSRESIFMWGIFCVQSIGNTSLCPDTVWWGGACGSMINCCYNTHAWDRRVHTHALTNDSVLFNDSHIDWPI